MVGVDSPLIAADFAQLGNKAFNVCEGGLQRIVIAFFSSTPGMH
jgi:hypothetical protein